MKYKPKKPEKGSNLIKQIVIADMMSLNDLLERKPTHFDDAIFFVDHDEDDSYVRLCFYEDETEEQFQNRLKQYYVDLKDYLEWVASGGQEKLNTEIQEKQKIIEKLQRELFELKSYK